METNHLLIILLEFDNVKIDKLKVSEDLINDSEFKISSNLKSN